MYCFLVGIFLSFHMQYFCLLCVWAVFTWAFCFRPLFYEINTSLCSLKYYFWLVFIWKISFFHKYCWKISILFLPIFIFLSYLYFFFLFFGLAILISIFFYLLTFGVLSFHVLMFSNFFSFFFFHCFLFPQQWWQHLNIG